MPQGLFPVCKFTEMLTFLHSYCENRYTSGCKAPDLKACLRDCVRNQVDLGPQVQYQTILHGDYVFFPIVLFFCELFFSSAVIFHEVRFWNRGGGG